MRAGATPRGCQMFDVVEVQDEAPHRFESVGTKPKFWFDHEGQQTLFKECREGTGEDWAEKIACELCRELGLPHADVELAIWKGKRGIVTPSFVTEGSALVLGNEILGSFIPDYPTRARGTREHYRVPQYSLDNILAVVGSGGILPPSMPELPTGVEDAADAFAGYLMLDAWIANQDRHHENWGIILEYTAQESGEFVARLAPTFDHASSLARNETDTVLSARLRTKDKRFSVEAYAARARSAVFASEQDRKPMFTFDVFQKTAQLRPTAARAWLNRLAGISGDIPIQLFADVPPQRISPTAAEFAGRMLEINRNRLLEV